MLTALALHKIAENLPRIGTVNLTPDVLTQALTQLSQAAPAAGRSAPKAPNQPARPVK